MRSIPESKCPCCGQGISPLKLFVFTDGNIASYNGDAIHLNNMQTAITRVLAEAWPNALTNDQIVSRIWGNKPLPSALPTLRVYIRDLRRNLKKLDIEILCNRDCGYRLSLPHQVSISRAAAQRLRLAA